MVGYTCMYGSVIFFAAGFVHVVLLPCLCEISSCRKFGMENPVLRLDLQP